MARLVLAAALVFTPAPVTPRQEAKPWHALPPSARVVQPAAPTSSTYIWDDSATWESSFAATVSPAPLVSAPPEIPPAPTIPPPELTLRERALNRLTELGAQPWQVVVFDCIGLHESGWENVDHRNPDGSVDAGVYQLNSIHRAQLAAEGLDPHVPEDAAQYAWQLSRQGTTFRPWVVAPICVRN